MVKWKRCVWPLFCLLLAGITVLMYIQLDKANADCYTVCMYREGWSDKYSDYVTRRIAPMKEAMWVSGSHDAKPVKVRFDGTILRQSAGYGPTGLNGVFAAEDVNALCGQAILTEDWPFGWGIYFTNDWCVCDVYLAVQLPQEPDGEVTATLTVYSEGSAKPVEVRTWTGRIGEQIVFGGLEI